MAYSGLSLYKLMILYMLEKITFPLSNNQIVTFLLDGNYTDYFQAQQAISDLMEAGQIRAEAGRRTTLYSITGEGMETAQSMENMLDASLRTEILDYLKENAFTLRSESGIRSDYRLTPSREYEVSLSVIEEGAPLLSLKVNVMTKEEAEIMCRNWETRSSEVYLQLMRALLNE